MLNKKTLRKITYQSWYLFQINDTDWNMYVTGLFTRRMILSFHKMSFSQVSHFVDLLRIYLQDDCASVNIDMATDSGEGVSIQSMENEKDESMTEKTRLCLVS